MSLLEGGYNGWGTALKRAQRFVDPLNAWGAACKQIYPCTIDVLCTEEE